MLIDSSPNGIDARRTRSAKCTTGIDGQAIAFDENNDVVEVPEDPAFNLGERFAVAAWVNPTQVKTGAIINKQGPGRTPFELYIDKGELVFSVDVLNRGIVTSRAPIQRNRWTHVGGFFDGRFVFLFMDGEQVGQVAARGQVRDKSLPIRIGNNRGGQFIRGAVDRVFISNSLDLTGQIFAELSCFRQPLDVTVSPLSSGPVDPDVPFTYDIAITNNDFGACGARFAFVSPNFFEEGISVSTNDSFEPLTPGVTRHVDLVVVGSSDAEPGTRDIGFVVFADPDFEGIEGSVEFTLNAPTGCFVRTGRELMIRDLSVVEDPVRTTWDDPTDPNTGVWTFGGLMSQLAPTPELAPVMVEQIFSSFVTDQTINGFLVPARPAMQDIVLDSWPRTANGQLDLTRSPLRLLAIVNRIDLRDLDKGQAGEGRFVFGVLDSEGFPLQFTLIMEIALPATTEAEVLDWADRWHALSELPFPSEEYNVALQAITEAFAGRGVMPGRPNGSALNQLRTDEFALDPRWELREFRFGANDMLVPSTVQLTPDTSFMDTNTQLVTQFINQNEATILAERHTVPEVFNGTRFGGGGSFNDLIAWTPAVNNPEARHKFSLNTCNGCHSIEETGTFFLHVSPRFEGERAQLSGFMTGITLNDVVTGEPRTLNDLGRRNVDLKLLVCDDVQPLARTSATTTTSDGLRPDFIRKGIGRVH